MQGPQIPSDLHLVGDKPSKRVVLRSFVSVLVFKQKRREIGDYLEICFSTKKEFEKQCAKSLSVKMISIFQYPINGENRKSKTAQVCP